MYVHVFWCVVYDQLKLFRTVRCCRIVGPGLPPHSFEKRYACCCQRSRWKVRLTIVAFSRAADLVSRFLAALTIYKATADVARGGRMFEEQSSVPDSMLPWRSTVIAFKQPRRQLVQPVTRMEGENVILQVPPARFCSS